MAVVPASATPVSEPITKSSDYMKMIDFWTTINDILGGVQKIRDGGEKYLPRFPNEVLTVSASGRNYDPYRDRLNKAPFTNIYEDISHSLSSKPFAKPMMLKQDADPVYKTLAENIDGQGNNIHVFSQEVFKSGMDKGISWIFVDFPPAAPVNRPLTITEERELGRRPYWVFIRPENLMAVYSDFIDGREIIVHARILEPTIKLDGFIERTVERVRVLNRLPIEWDVAGKPTKYGPAFWQLYESIVDDTNNTATWVIVQSGIFTIGVIPLVPFMSGEREDKASFVVKPPLRSLANMQIYEYQQESNLQHVLELAGFPMLSGNGVEPPSDTTPRMVVGPRTVLFGGRSLDGQPGYWSFIEPAGTSIAALEKHLGDTQKNMRDLGHQPITIENLTVITTGQVAVKANSAVEAWVIRFKDTIEQCLVFTSMWLSRTDAPSVDIWADFTIGLDDGKGFEGVLKMREMGDLSHESTIDAAIRYNVVRDNFDIEKNDEELAKEKAEKMEDLQGQVDPVTGKPVSSNVVNLRESQ